MLLRAALILALLAGCLAGQNVNGLIRGAVTDPSGSALPGASLSLRNAATSTVLATTSNAVGIFVFPSVPPGVYDLTVEAAGFQRHVTTAIQLNASENRDLGQLEMSIGEVQQSVTVADTAAALQLASGEKSGLVSGTQLNELALKGRDFLGLMSLVTGVVDTKTGSREATSPASVGGININGNRSNMKNFTLDGVGAMDTGSNDTIHYQPNMDSIAEVKVLTSNYQAEYGRSAGGLISVITKGGAREFRGSGWWNHRHEGLNANNFFRNRTGLQKSPYRYNIAGFTFGGPVYLPGKWNVDRNRLFFFVSQEYTRQRVDYGDRFKNMPTELERQGNFSRSVDVGGRLIPITDPTMRAPFPGNIIPASRINPIGKAIVGFFPMPNYTDPDPARVHSQNYRTANSGAYPRRNDMVRLDANLTSKLNGYFRWISDSDESEQPYSGYDFSYAPYTLRNPGHGYAGHLIYTIGPTLVNDLTVGKGWNSWQWSPTNASLVTRERLGPVPQWYQNQPRASVQSEVIDASQMPNITFGATPVNAPAINVNSKQHLNYNNTWDVTNNFSWVKGSHTVKTGVFYSFVDKVVATGSTWNGAFNFAPNRNNPFDANHGYANALLGNYLTYTESGKPIDSYSKNWGLELYVQDNWRVNRRLSLDYGVRFYHMSPDSDQTETFSVFDPSGYNPAKAPVLYRPGLDGNTRVAVNPLTGQTTYPVLIGRYVPGSGDYANGMRVPGRDGLPKTIFGVSALSAAPRFGFAFDPGGNGSTVIRGGAGLFLDRPRLLLVPPNANNPPVDYRPTANYGNIADLTAAVGDVGPSNMAFALGLDRVKMPSVLSYSFGVQHRLFGNTVADVSYVGNVSRHLARQRNINAIPMYARFDPANFDSTLPGQQPLPADFYRPYGGHGDLNAIEYAATANYNSLQASLQRRFHSGLGFGVSYTFSKALGVNEGWNDLVSSYFNPRSWDYGPVSFDRSHVFVVNYMYELPKLGKRLRLRPVAAITDGWSVSGVTSFVSGSPFTPALGTTYTTDITGSTEGARITIIGDPRLSKSEKSFGRNFRQEAFGPTPVRSFGNAGIGILRGPGINNWDIALNRRFPLGLGERRVLQFRGEFFNAFNHTQFSAIDAAARFDQAGRQQNAGFGAFTAARNPRIIAFSLRLQM
jgi:hypothetical protein